MASRSAREATRLRSAIIAALEIYDTSTKPRDDDPPRFSYADYFSSAEYKRLPDDAKSPTDKDVESDEATWALYERWSKAFNKERGHAEMVRRFKLFRYQAKYVHRWNTRLPSDPEKAAIFLQKREEAKLRISKGQDVSGFDELHLPMELGPFADGGDPFLTERNKSLLKMIEERDPFSAVEDVRAK